MRGRGTNRRAQIPHRPVTTSGRDNAATTASWGQYGTHWQQEKHLQAAAKKGFNGTAACEELMAVRSMPLAILFRINLSNHKAFLVQESPRTKLALWYVQLRTAAFYMRGTSYACYKGCTGLVTSPARDSDRRTTKQNEPRAPYRMPDSLFLYADVFAKV